MKMRRLMGRALGSHILRVLAACHALAFIGASPAVGQTRVRVDAQKPGPVIAKNVYGQFAEHLGRGIYEGIWVGGDSDIPNTKGFRKDVLQALKELAVPVVRWPGGCFADQYHWRDGIGPQNRRKRTVNASWGGVAENNSFGTHEFFDLVELLGADAYVNINVGTGTPREMMEWIEYMTSASDGAMAHMRRRNGRQQPWRVHYLGIGNEPWGCGGSMTPQRYADEFKHFATFVKTPKDNSPLIVASGSSGNSTEWTQLLLEQVKPSWTLRMDGIAHHYYTLPTANWDRKGAALGFPEEEWFSTLHGTLRIREILKKNVQVMDRLDPKGRVGFFLDEWGTWYDSAEGESQSSLYQQNSLRDAVVAALNFHAFHDYAERVRMTNIAQMVNVLQAMILTRGPRMLKTPTYHAYRMYVPFQGARRLPVSVRGARKYSRGSQRIERVSATAARGRDGKVYVGLVNTHPAEAEVVRLDSSEPILRAKGQVLSSEDLDAHNTFEHPSRVRPVAVEVVPTNGRLQWTLPPKSVAVFRLE